MRVRSGVSEQRLRIWGWGGGGLGSGRVYQKEKYKKNRWVGVGAQGAEFTTRGNTGKLGGGGQYWKQNSNMYYL